MKLLTKNPVRPRKNAAEGGCGGNSAAFLQKIEASPAARLRYRSGGNLAEKYPPLS